MTAQPSSITSADKHKHDMLQGCRGHGVGEVFTLYMQHIRYMKCLLFHVIFLPVPTYSINSSRFPRGPSLPPTFVMTFSRRASLFPDLCCGMRQQILASYMFLPVIKAAVRKSHFHSLKARKTLCILCTPGIPKRNSWLVDIANSRI